MRKLALGALHPLQGCAQLALGDAAPLLTSSPLPLTLLFWERGFRQGQAQLALDAIPLSRKGRKQQKVWLTLTVPLSSGAWCRGTTGADAMGSLGPDAMGSLGLDAMGSFGAGCKVTIGVDTKGPFGA